MYVNSVNLTREDDINVNSLDFWRELKFQECDRIRAFRRKRNSTILLCNIIISMRVEHYIPFEIGK